MKILVIGLGSAGQRHVRNLKLILGDGAEISVYRTIKKELIIDSKCSGTYGKSPEEFYGLKTYFSFEEALNDGQDMVVISNPNSMHVQTAIQAIKKGCHVFLEKPLSNNWDGVNELQNLIKEKNRVCCIGYQQRYHPGLKLVKKYLEDGRLGNISAVYSHFGEYLPGMHPYEDYRESYISKEKNGGGVILSFSHEIDIIYWLFGMPKTVYAVGGHLSDLEIKVEDTASITMECVKNEKIFPVHIHLDFIQSPPSRWMKIIGDQAVIEWDYYTNNIIFRDTKESTSVTHSFEKFDRNQMFIDEMMNWIECIKNQKVPNTPVSEGADVLQISLAAKESIKEKRIVKLPL